MTAPAPKFHEHQTGVFWDRLRASAVRTYRANGFGVAKGAAYSGLLSFFPILTTVAALLVQALGGVIGALGWAKALAREHANAVR